MTRRGGVYLQVDVLMDTWFNPCAPCCVPPKVYCNPRICYRFVNAWTKEPISVTVLQPTTTQCGGFRVVAGEGPIWCFEPYSLNASGECVPTLKEVPVGTDGLLVQPPSSCAGAVGNAGYACCGNIFANIIWDMGGGHLCSGWVVSPPALCCTTGTQIHPLVDWPICCPEICFKVNSPPIPHQFGCNPPGGPLSDYGVGVESASVSQAGAIGWGPDYPVGLFPCGGFGQCFNPGLFRVNGTSCSEATTRWTSCPPGALPSPASANTDPLASDPRFINQQSIKMVASPTSNYQMAGACGDEVHRLWGNCQSITYKPCSYNEFELTLTDHAGSVVPWCFQGCQEKCAEVPTTVENPKGEMLCGKSYSDIPSLNVTIMKPECGGFSGGSVAFDCNYYNTGRCAVQGYYLTQPTCLPGWQPVKLHDPGANQDYWSCQQCANHGIFYNWKGCVGISGPSYKVNHCRAGWVQGNCPSCNSCYDVVESVKSVLLEVDCSNGTLSVVWNYYFNNKCDTCYKCDKDNKVICQHDESSIPGNAIQACSGCVGQPCFSCDWMTGSFREYGAVTSAVQCPACPDCCWAWWQAGGCSPACPSDVAQSCEKCITGALAGPKFISYNPLLIEMRGCVIPAGGLEPVCGELQGIITNG